MSDLPPDFCPYKGLLPYTEEDREFFFGRERDSKIIASNLYASSLTVLYGASGVGKSSVLLAGVVPNLKRDPRSVVVVFRDWQDTTFRAALKREVLSALSRFPDKKAVVDPKMPLDEFLVQCRVGLRMSLFFLLDQFEEYFLYHPTDPGQDGFEAEFARAVNRRDVDANFLIALREDGLSKLDRFQGRIPNLLANRLRLDHLRQSDAENAIRKPLDEYNRRRPAGSRQVTVDDALVARVIEQVKMGRVVLGEAGQGQLDARSSERADEFGVETPFLQMVMTRLWDEATGPGVHPPGEAVTLGVNLLDRLGGAERIVRSYLDKVMESELDSEGRNIAARLFRFLVTPTGSKIAHTVGDLASYAEQPTDRVEAVLNRLCSPSVRVLRPVTSMTERGEATRFEIFHDVLASAVLDWSRQRFVALEVERQRFEQRRQAEMDENRRVAAAERQRAEEAEALKREAEAAAGRQKKLSQRFLIAAAVSFLLALAAGWQSLRAYRASQKAATAIQIATSRQLAFLSASEQNKRLDLSLLLAVTALQTANTFEARDSLYQALQVRPGLLSFLHINDGPVTSVAFSPDRRTIAAGYAGGVGGVVLWDAAARKRLVDAPLAVGEGPVRGVAFSPDGGTIAAGYGVGGGGGVVLWDAAARKRLVDAPLAVGEGDVESVAFSPDGGTIAAGYGVRVGGGVVLWDAAAHKRLVDAPLAVGEGYVRGVAFSPDGGTIAAGYAGVRVVVGGVVLWDAAARKRLVDAPLAVGEGYVESVAFSPDGGTIAAGYGGILGVGGVVLWDAAARKRLVDAALAVGEGDVESVAFSPDGGTIAAGYSVGGVGGGVVLWEAAARKRLVDAALAVGEGDVESVAFSPDGGTIAAGYSVGGVGGGVVLWDAAAHKRLVDAPLAVGEGPVRGVAFSPDGRTIAAGYGVRGVGGGVVLWDAAAHKRLVDAPLAVGEGPVRGVAFSPDGRTIAVGYGVGVGGGVVLWDAAARKRLVDAPLAVGEGDVESVAFSPDGRTIAAGYGVGVGGGVVLWDAAARKRLVDAPLAVGEGYVESVAFSPDGGTIAAGYAGVRVVGGGVVLWDAAARKRLVDAPLAVGEGPVRGVAFSLDGGTIAAGYGGVRGVGGVVLWDAAARKRLVDAPLAVGEGPVRGVAFSLDGGTIAAGYGGVRGVGGVVLWDVDLQSWQRLAGQIANRNFTRAEWRQFFPEEPYRATFPDLPVPPEIPSQRGE